MDEFISEEERLKQTVWLGAEAEKFLVTPLGKYLITRAQQERDDAMLQLRTVDPEDSKKIRELQSTIARAESFPTWIDELIREGNIAYDEFVAETTITQE